MKPSELTFHAEEKATYEELKVLVQHENRVVREGAIYGLLRIKAEIDATLQGMTETDDSPGVLWAAKEA